MKLKYSFFLLILFCFLTNSNLFSQSRTECGTRTMPIPNFKQSDYEAFERSFFEKVKRGVQFELIRVPIKAHIVRPASGVGGYTEAQLNTELARVNAFYANANIEFYVCNSVNYVNNDDLYDYGASDAEETALSANNVVNIMNVYFTNMTVYCGYAYFPGGPDLVVMSNSCATNGSTLAHEIGHYFGLYHTHDTNNGAELVNGTNCSTAGDLMCDTPADPTLGSTNVNNSTDCVYTGTTVDANGQAYTPDTRNVMSYSLKTCRTRFSAQQYARIAYIRENQRAYLTCSTAPTCAAPSTPSVSSITTNSATVSWAAVTGATAYRVEYKLATATTWTALANTTALSQSISGLSANMTYNVRVFTVCSTLTSSASVTANFTTNSLTSCTDANEPNNVLAQSKSIAVNSITNGSISTAGDVDYFSFTTTSAASNIVIELGNLANDFDLYLVNASDVTLGSSLRRGAIREQIFFNTTTAGTYYIKVVGYNNATHTNCYRLTVLTDASAQSCN